MTSYHIEVGYNSAHYREEVWDELKRATLDLCERPLLLAKEAYSFDASNLQATFKCFFDHAVAYKRRNDLTIQIQQRVDKDGNELNDVSQAASGGGLQRDVKESLRRAFCRLILSHMHKNGMEINIFVC